MDDVDPMALSCNWSDFGYGMAGYGTETYSSVCSSLLGEGAAVSSMDTLRVNTPA